MFWKTENKLPLLKTSNTSSKQCSEHQVVIYQEIEQLMNNCIMMECSHWQISARKRGFLGFIRLQIIYKLQFFKLWFTEHLCLSLPVNLIRDRNPDSIPSTLVSLISCNCSLLEKTQQLTKYKWVCVASNERGLYIVPLVCRVILEFLSGSP